MGLVSIGMLALMVEVEVTFSGENWEAKGEGL